MRMRDRPQPAFVFRSVWPVTDLSDIGPAMFEDAKADLPAVARRSAVRLIGEPRMWLEPSTQVRGSRNATWLSLVAEAPAVARDRPYLRGDGSG